MQHWMHQDLIAVVLEAHEVVAVHDFQVVRANVGHEPLFFLDDHLRVGAADIGIHEDTVGQGILTRDRLFGGAVAGKRDEIERHLGDPHQSARRR